MGEQIVQTLLPSLKMHYILNNKLIGRLIFRDLLLYMIITVVFMCHVVVVIEELIQIVLMDKYIQAIVIAIINVTI